MGLFYIPPCCVVMQAALIIALFIESHICDKSFFYNKILDKVIHLLIFLTIITKVGSD